MQTNNKAGDQQTENGMCLQADTKHDKKCPQVKRIERAVSKDELRFQLRNGRVNE